MDMGGYVTAEAEAEARKLDGDTATARVTIGRRSGSESLEQRILRFGPGRSRPRGGEAREEVLFVVSGSGTLDFDGEEHPLEPETGAYVAPGRRYAVESSGPEELVLVSVLALELQTAAVEAPRRPTVRLADRPAHPAGKDREFRYVVGADTGCRTVTQFVGSVPPGRAKPHYHEYEEVAFILEGEGVLHTAGRREPVAAGSCIHGRGHDDREHRFRPPRRCAAGPDADGRRRPLDPPRADDLPRRVRLGEPAHRAAERDQAALLRSRPRRHDDHPAARAPGHAARGEPHLMDRLLELRNVSKSFGGLLCIDHLDLHVAEGEIVSVIGPNGAGKTTLFNLVTGIYAPDRGDIFFDGQSIVGLDPHRIAQRGIARTFQTLRLFLNMTVKENVMAATYGHTKARVWQSVFRTPFARREERETEALAEERLAFFGKRLVGYRLEQPAYSLSYANRRRLEIARATGTKPRLLLLDEPAAGMNPVETREMAELIGRLRREGGYTILVIEHDMHVVEGISDRVVALDHGERIAEGTFEQVATNPRVVEAYLGARAVEAE
jgi:branched-chain amino acid transport system ATP-binding protein